MAGFAGMHEEGRRAGGGEGGGDLAADMAGLADAGDDDAALPIADEIDRRREGAAQPVAQRGGERAMPPPSASSVRSAELIAACVRSRLWSAGKGRAMRVLSVAC